MRTDPSTNHIVLDYCAMTDKFGLLRWNEFIARWHAADARRQAGLAEGIPIEEIAQAVLVGEAGAAFMPRGGSLREQWRERRIGVRRE